MKSFLIRGPILFVSTPDRTTLDCQNGTTDDAPGTDGGTDGGTDRDTDGVSNSGSNPIIHCGGGGGLPGEEEEEMVTTRAKLSLVDLAGSEKGTGSAVGSAQERERSRINSSLSALSNCISCLGDARRTHVPFRDNPLTRWANLNKKIC